MNFQGADYRTRQAEIFDIERIMAIEHKSFAPAIAEKPCIFEERLKTAPECNHVLYSTADTQIYGYFTSEIWRTPVIADKAFSLGHSTAQYHFPDGSILYISSFAILPALRGKKIGIPDRRMGIAKLFFTTALQTVLSEHPKIEQILLLVHEDWQNAQRIYESQGFVRIKTFPVFHDFAGASAFIYKKAR